jgi:hypothetical protein
MRLHATVERHGCEGVGGDLSEKFDVVAVLARVVHNCRTERSKAKLLR